MRFIGLHSFIILLLASAVLASSPARTRPTPFERAGRWGFRDGSGKVVVEPRFIMAQEFSPEGIAAVVDDAGWAYIDSRGSVVARPFPLDNGPDCFREGLARFVQDGKLGFMDKTGKKVIAARFDFALPFQEGLAAVCSDCSQQADGEHTRVTGGRWGFINLRGRVVLPLRYEEAKPFEKGRAQVKLRGRWVSVDRKGRASPPRR